MNKKIHLMLDYSLIQNIRFIQALMESDYSLVISKEHEQKFEELKRVFNIKYEKNFDNSVVFDDYKVLHDKPLTKIGEIEKPLIFPHAIVYKCRNMWKNDRKILCSFSGLITEDRMESLNHYIKRNYNGEHLEMICKDPAYKKIIKKMKILFNQVPKINQRKIGDIVFWSSFRGRTFPIKAWDEDYFKLLSNSKFVLCPNGDFVWTYRFFESILCGAIPIVEDTCSLYDGFRYKTMKDKLKTLTWNQEDADFNYKLCIEKLTIPIKQLNEEVTRSICKGAQFD